MRKTERHDWRRFDAQTEAEVHAAALKDPDALPLTDDALTRLKPVPRARTLRRALGLTQEEFAERYHIPIGTLRDWEQGRTVPDQPARAYLIAIAHDPEGVRCALRDRRENPTGPPGRKSEIMLRSTLHRLIPHEVRTFAKLRHGEPYHFGSWKNDNADTPCLYYWFMARNGVTKNDKRVPVSEIGSALQRLRDAGVLSREMFAKVCPVAESAGPCGFAVVGRIFEALGVAVYSGRGGFELTNADKAQKLLDV
jgi:putative transcriptional regulator